MCGDPPREKAASLLFRAGPARNYLWRCGPTRHSLRLESPDALAEETTRVPHTAHLVLPILAGAQSVRALTFCEPREAACDLWHSWFQSFGRADSCPDCRGLLRVRIYREHPDEARKQTRRDRGEVPLFLRPDPDRGMRNSFPTESVGSYR